MIFKTYISDLKQASMVVDNVKQATTTTAYANAIKGLSVEQAKLALSTKQLSALEKEHILIKAGLLNATGKLTTGQLTAILTNKQRNAEDAKALLLSTGLISAETAEATAVNVVETAKLKELVATKQLTVAEAELIAMKAKVTTSNIKEATSTAVANGKMSGSFAILGKTVGSSLKNIGNGLLSFAASHPLIAMLTTTIGIVAGVNSKLKKYEQEQQELIKNAKSLQDEYRSFVKSSSDNINSLKSQAEEFEELSKGVTQYGENISLSADEYDRYKSIVAEVLGYTPELIDGHNAEGTAIANKNSLIERSIELMKEEQRQKLKEMTTDEKTGTVYDAAIASMNKSKSYDVKARNNITSLFRDKGEWESLKALGLYNEFQAYKSKASSANQNITSFVHDNYELIINTIKENKMALYDAQNNFGKNIFTSKEVDNLVDWANDWQEAYVDWKEKIEDAKHGMDDQFELYAQRADGYDDLTDAQRTFVNEYIKATGDIVDADGHILSEDEIIEKAESYEKFVDKLTTSPEFADTRKKINELFTLDSSTISAGKYEKQVNDILEELQTKLELTDDEVKDFKIALGFDFIEDGNSTRVSELVEKVQEKLKDDFDDKALDLSLDDLIIASNLEVPEGVELSWEKFIKLLNEAKDIPYTPTDSFTSIFNSEDFEESKEALLELAKTGEISTDVIESSEEYRKLITQTGLSAIEATERIRKMVDATTRLSDMSSDLGTLSTAYKEFKENGYASAESIEALREKFGDLKNAKGEELFENFAYVIGSSTATTQEQQKAFNNLVSAYLTSEKVFEKLTNENKDYYITQLKAIGVMNSEALITNELAGKKKALELQDEALAITADGFNKATSEKIKALMGENAAAQSCRIALFQLTANEQIFNSNKLDAESKIRALVELASAYGVTSEYIERAQKSINADDANGGHTGLNFTNADVKHAIKDVYEGVYASIADYEFNFDLGLGDIDFGLDEDSTDNIFDWIETRISRLQNTFQKMVDSVTKYVSQNFKLDSIDKQIASLDEQISTYYAGAEKYLEKANSISIDGSLRHKVINGEIEIETLTEDENKAVTEFKEWYEKYLDAIDNAAQLERDKRDKLREKLDARTWALQQQRERLSTKSDRKQDAIDFKESLEGSANTSEYQWLINNADKQYENINAENTLLKEYLATLDSTSEEWADIQSQIESNESSMRDLISSQVEWNNKIAQMPIDKAEKAIEKLSGKEERINAKYENTNSSWAKRKLNDILADIKSDTLKQYRNAYETTKENYSTSAYRINNMSSKDSLVSNVQKYTKSGKEIPSDVLTAVYNSGNTLLIRRCEQYNAAYLARETAKDTYDLNKEQIKTDLADLGQKNLDTITDAYANKNTTIDNKKSLINARKENTEAKGRYADEAYYNQLIAQVSHQVDAKVSERNKLKEIIDQNIKDGLWTKESQMYKDAMAQVDQLGIEIVELSTEQANYNNELNQMPIDRLQTALDILDKLSSRDSSKNDLKKALGKDLSVDDYQKEFNNIKKQEDKTLQLRNKYYQKYINAKQKGRDADADKYLQLYYEEDAALNNLKVSFEELKDEMRDDVYWRDFERAHKAAENLKTTIASIIDLYSDEMLFNDNGALTDMGVSKMGALLKEYELAKTEVVNYTNDLKNLNNLYDTGMYTEEEYKEKLAEIKNGLLDATKETKSYNDALRDMVISQKEIELEALNELIDKRKEALNAKKEYYDYDKNIKEKTKEIQSLQAQVAALEGIETAEAKAQLARAKSELQEAQDDLEETKFDHKLEVILDGFDLLQTDLQENHDAYVKNLKSSFDEQIEIISNANSLIGQSYSEVIRSITNMLQFYGVDTSSIDVGSLAGFATGGIVRAVRRNGDSALVSVNPDETILTKKFTDLLPDTVQMMSQFVNIPKMNYDFVPRRNDTPVININYDKMLHIEGNVFDMEKATMDVVKNNMKTIAKGVSNDLSTQWRKLGHK